MSRRGPCKTAPARLAQARLQQRLRRAAANSYIVRLEATVQDLQHENARLEVQAAARQNQADTVERPLDRTMCANVATAYFKACRLGAGSAEHRAVLEHLISQSIVLTNGRGLAEFWTQWHRYTTFFGELEMVCDRMQVVQGDDVDTVQCHGRLLVRVHRETLRHLFPLVLGNEHLAQRLIGRRLEVLWGARQT
ncbi:hypothetical protein ACHHYP_20305 [Achlya hypogyna]|uniref:BZIP domain-containing protein n=1 Tax=Achlya hypogyna TaxID=1202772 RepID=A0A1V9YRP7_ACHHY|nr:hypothetical protein ACHHYP_20305 [Achlya hypogyna]